MALTKPTVAFIPGFWHSSEGFGPLAAILQKANYQTVLIDLPSTDAHPGHPDSSQDIAFIRNIVSDLVEKGEELVMVMHSGGSIAGSNALPGLSKKEREAEGKKGGVVRLMYIGILLPEKGKNIFETFNSVVTSPDLDPNFVIDQSQEFHVIAEDGTSTITDGDTRFYNDLPPEEAKYWSSKLKSLSLSVAMSPLTYEAWKYIPSAYVICLKDKSIPLKQIRDIVKNAKIEVVFEIETGHCPYLAQPQTVAGFIKEAAGEAT